MKIILIATAALVLEGLAGSALAAPAPAPDPRVLAARVACDSGDVDKGVALLVQIASETGDNNALFNQARCYQQNGRKREALERFKEYRRRAKDLSAADARLVDTYVHELEGDLARQEAPPAPALAPAAPQPPPETAVPPPAGRGSGQRVAAAVVGGTGALALAAGAYFSLRVRSLSDELGSASPPITAAEFRDKKRQGEDAAKYQWVGYGVGAAALTTAAVLLFIGESTGEKAANPVSVRPTLAPGTAGAVVGLSF